MVAVAIVLIMVAIWQVAAVFWLRRVGQRRVSDVGFELVPPHKVKALFFHDRACVRWIEKILNADSQVPFLSERDRETAERLIHEFYNDKGDG